MELASHDVLFEPIMLKNVEVKNRIAMAPMNMCYTDNDNMVSDQQLAYYAARALGGVGLVVVEAVGASDHETCMGTYAAYKNLMLTRPTHLTGMAELAETVHTCGSKIIVQIAIGPGRQGTDAYTGIQPVAPSPIAWIPQPDMMPPGIDFMKTFELGAHPPGGLVPREITVEELEILVRDLGESAKLARIADLDGVEIHAPHGYLIHSFLSPRSNKRTDKYGGSIENRARLLVDCVKSVRAAVGDDYLLTVRISADEHMPDGFHVDETIEFCKMAVAAGADGIHLSDGCYEAMKYFLPVEDGQVVEESGRIKAALGEVPVVCPSVHNPDLAAETVSSGKADMISIGRGLLADPEWPNKVKAGRAKDIVKCTRCNKGCISRFVLGLPARCILNPELGQEKYIAKYNTRPVLPLKKRVWKTLAEY